MTAPVLLAVEAAKRRAREAADVVAGALHRARKRRAQRAATFDALMVPAITSHDPESGLVEGTASPTSTIRLIAIATGALLGMTVADSEGAWAILAEGLTGGDLLITYAHDAVGHVKPSAVFEVAP